MIPNCTCSTSYLLGSTYLLPPLLLPRLGPSRGEKHMLHSRLQSAVGLLGCVLTRRVGSRADIPLHSPHYTYLLH